MKRPLARFTLTMRPKDWDPQLPRDCKGDEPCGSLSLLGDVWSSLEPADGPPMLSAVRSLAPLPLSTMLMVSLIQCFALIAPGLRGNAPMELIC